MDNAQGIKETKEAISGAMKLGALLYASFRDGVQTEDIGVIFAKVSADPVLKQALLDAYNGAENINAELKEISTAEGIELAIHILSEGAKVFAEVK